MVGVASTCSALSFGDGCVDFRFGGLGVDAAAQLQPVQILRGLRELQHFRLQVFGSDFGLMFVNPVVILPESRRASAENALSGDGRGLAQGWICSSGKSLK